jgi:death-on-curing protein
MRYLYPEQLLFLHARLVDETGGSHGVRDLNMLLSALGRPQASYDTRDLYPTIYTKSAALMDSLIRNHPFLDGNKRTGIAAAAMFLRMNGYQLNATNTELEKELSDAGISNRKNRSPNGLRFQSGSGAWIAKLVSQPRTSGL